MESSLRPILRPLTAASLLLSLLLVNLSAAAIASAGPGKTTANEQSWSITSLGSQASGRWQTFDLDVEVDSQLEIVADWKGDANVNLFLRRDGSPVAHANSRTAQPEVLLYDAEAGRYNLAVLVKSGDAAYTVDVKATSTQAEDGTLVSEPDVQPEVDRVIGQWPISAEGSQSSGRWQIFDLDVEFDSQLEIVAEWKGDANVNLFLRRDGSLVAHANSRTAQPEVLLYDAEAGRYNLAVLVKSGDAAYTVDVTATPTQAEDGTLVSEPERPSAEQESAAGPETEQPSAEPEQPAAEPESATGPETEQPSAEPEQPAAEPESATGPETEQSVAESEQPGAEPDPELAFVPAYPGQPAPGTVVWGSSVHGNGDPYVRHEQFVGTPLGVRRTFFQWHARAGAMIRMAEGDVAVGRLPWVSVKTPSWAAMAAGEHDAEIDQMLRALDGVAGPVWLTVHHEPEGGGGTNYPDDPAGPEAHVAMNKRVRERMDALGVDNVALAPIFMAWSFDPRSGRDVEAWWEDGIYDFLGVDIYQRSEQSKITDNWLRVRQWADDRGVDVAVGEWGLRGTDEAAGARVHEWFDHAIRSAVDGQGARVIGLSAFDSGLNSPSGSWELQGEQLMAFRELIADRRAARSTYVE